MNVLNSEDAFLEHYSTHVPGIFSLLSSVGAGGAVGGGIVSAAAATAGTAAAQASMWSMFTWLPLVGTIAAGKAAAVGAAATVAAATSATVLVPAILLGGGAAYAIYRLTSKKSLQEGTGIEELANAFARVACLPMMALAVSVCKGAPGNTESVRAYLLKELGAWGYAESYVNAGFDEAIRYSADELNSQYEWAMGQLKSGTTEGIGATPEELPYKAVKSFADDFRKGFESCIG